MITIKSISIRTLAVMAFCIALNFLGNAVVIALRLPIYLDSIGTVFSAALFGPIAGISVGILSSVISGATTDIFALYYVPVQIVTGLLAGLLLHQARLNKWRLPLQALLISLPGTILASLITAFLFHGITSSGSSMLVQVLTGLGINQVVSIILVQMGTDYLDRLITLLLVSAVFSALGTRLQKRK